MLTVPDKKMKAGYFNLNDNFKHGCWSESKFFNPEKDILPLFIFFGAASVVGFIAGLTTKSV